MAIHYVYVYSPEDFEGGLPDEQGAAAAGGPNFTLTLKAGAAPSVVAINDDDAIFDEVDGSQMLSSEVTIDGQVYGAGTSVNTAYDLINTGSGHKVTSLHFGGNGYQQGAVDGLVSTVELQPGQSYNFNYERTSHQKANAYDDYVACFLPGTRIATPRGPVPVEALAVGDLVTTVDDGPRPIRWVGARTVLGLGKRAPVRIPAGWNGLARDLTVSPQHRMLIRGARCQLLLGCASALVSARALADLGLAEVRPQAIVRYHHIMFDRHQIVLAEGAPSESLLLCDRSLRGFAAEASAEILSLFPELGPRPMEPARPILRGYEARAVLSA